MTKFGYRMLAASAALFVASTGHAASMIDANGSVILDGSALTSNPLDDFSFTVVYNGFINQASNVLPGLKSEILFKFLGTSAATGTTSYDFSYTLINNSGFPLDNSRASIFGFNVDPNVTGVTASGLFPDAIFTGDPLNTPNAGPNVELCIKDVKGNADNCTGGASGGVFLGDSGDGAFSLLFDTPPAVPTATLSNFYIRYQDIDSVALNLKGASASGLGTAIPEPATWVLMIGGFALVGGAMRRRRKAPRFATA